LLSTNMIYNLAIFYMQLKLKNNHLLISSIFIIVFVLRGNAIAKEVGNLWYTQTTFTAKYKEIGEFINSQAQPTDILLCGHGYPARESKLYNIDLAGLNSKIATDLKFNTSKIIQKYNPTWIACHGTNEEIKYIERDYALVRIDTLDFKSVKRLGFPYLLYYRVWKKKVKN
jgi:hypothetical protein